MPLIIEKIKLNAKIKKFHWNKKYRLSAICMGTEVIFSQFGIVCGNIFQYLSFEPIKTKQKRAINEVK